MQLAKVLGSVSLLALMALGCAPSDGSDSQGLCVDGTCDEGAGKLVASVAISQTETVSRCGPPDIRLQAEAGEILPAGSKLEALVFTNRAGDRTLSASFDQNRATGLIPLRLCDSQRDAEEGKIQSYFVQVFSPAVPDYNEYFEFSAANLKVGATGERVFPEDNLVPVSVHSFEVDGVKKPSGGRVFAKVKIRLNGVFQSGDEVLCSMSVRQADWTEEQMVDWGTVKLPYASSVFWGSGNNTEQAPGFVGINSMSSDPGDPDVMKEFIVRITLLKVGRNDLGGETFEFTMKDGGPDWTSVVHIDTAE